MANLLYNGVSLPAKPPAAAGYGVEVIVNVLPAGQSIYGGSPYLFVQGSRLLWQNGKCYVGGIYAVYRLSGDKWVWHYGSGTVSTQDIVAANYFEALWTNTDIPNANGSGIYLAATEPVDPDAPEEPDVPVEPDEPEEPEEPDEPTVTTAQLRRAFSNGFILGMQVRGMLKKKVVEEPDEPVTADFYLYGTPSADGNVAVADGDGYVLYDGIISTKIEGWEENYSHEIALTSNEPVAEAIYIDGQITVLPVWEKTVYPYATVGELYLLNWPLLIASTEPGVNLGMSAFEVPRPCLRWDLKDGVNWTGPALIEGEGVMSIMGPDWTNYDALPGNESAPVFPASDPIYIYEKRSD